jgi:hypothetical protein
MAQMHKLSDEQVWDIASAMAARWAFLNVQKRPERVRL